MFLDRHKKDGSPVRTPRKVAPKRPKPEAMNAGAKKAAVVAPVATAAATVEPVREKPLEFTSKTGKTAPVVTRKSPRAQKKARNEEEAKGKEEEEAAVAPVPAAKSGRKSPTGGKKAAAAAAVAVVTETVNENAAMTIEELFAELQGLKKGRGKAEQLFGECLELFRSKVADEFEARGLAEANRLAKAYLEQLDAELREHAEKKKRRKTQPREKEAVALLPEHQAVLEQAKRERVPAAEVAQAYVEAGLVMQQFADQVQQLSGISDAIQQNLESLAAEIKLQSIEPPKSKKAK